MLLKICKSGYGINPQKNQVWEKFFNPDFNIM